MLQHKGLVKSGWLCHLITDRRLFNMHIPKWAAGDSQQVVRFLLRHAALANHSSGQLSQLSASLGLSDSAINTAVYRGKVSRAVAEKIAALVGEEHFPISLITFSDTDANDDGF
jgi:hypothetical protein